MWPCLALFGFQPVPGTNFVPWAGRQPTTTCVDGNELEKSGARWVARDRRLFYLTRRAIMPSALLLPPCFHRLARRYPTIPPQPSFCRFDLGFLLIIRRVLVHALRSGRAEPSRQCRCGGARAQDHGFHAPGRRRG